MNFGDITADPGSAKGVKINAAASQRTRADGTRRYERDDTWARPGERLPSAGHRICPECTVCPPPRRQEVRYGRAISNVANCGLLRRNSRFFTRSSGLILPNLLKFMQVKHWGFFFFKSKVVSGHDLRYLTCIFFQTTLIFICCAFPVLFWRSLASNPISPTGFDCSYGEVSMQSCWSWPQVNNSLTCLWPLLHSSSTCCCST